MPPKLVRDRIPEIIRADGADPHITVAADDEYRRALRAKLTEETQEYLAADATSALEELADILEVVHALAAVHGADPAELEKTRRTKATERGAFTQRLIWHGNR
ncbi:nucleoside triphosphate pyrophosphohydrolase [Streptomonospora sp. S1-112]|uniref:Nucleoside triphosphate pyrophosphohydrolase n=1 Tax=Streptomonospora mangrovi TaxID=2883123 RepID=A0A9X3SH99_9ACTN|nr:nucleoside triphosphate pyrophosphohydrolase [Streptomonospora mangrovi]MDA0565019.1 nucleoside triphosphate pyrophosphohydrolase [Streptomonospora mangrovi]